MKVLHFILGKANKDRANGVNQVIAGLAKYTARYGVDVRVIGKAGSVKKEGELIQRDGFTIQAFSQLGLQLSKAVDEAIVWADVVHLHGVFSPWNLWVAKKCNQLQKPYVVTLHNGLALDRQTSTTTKIKKSLYHWLLQRQHLEKSAGIHMLTEEETTEALSWFSPRHQFYIPNGIDLDDYPTLLPHNHSQVDEIKIGYLGRVSPEKNLDSLCKAISLMRNNNNKLRLQIAGPESPYLKKLLTDYDDKGVEWVGPKYGADKIAFLRDIDLFVHPSLCDVFSIAAMEALAIGTPLLITRTAKASYFYDRQAFFMCEPTPYGLSRGLERALQQQTEWSQYILRGRELIENQLNWSIAAVNLIKEYDLIRQRVANES
ncbi:MAG: glycosyltransferase family 4 protein [Desulfobulbaceae bacterium]|nr:glycosyltransferase family 4 protein [Desulfobulbaceae bacterium]